MCGYSNTLGEENCNNNLQYLYNPTSLEIKIDAA